MDIDEIQGEDPHKIVTRKAEDAFKVLQKPVLVTDDSWAIPGLRGFPGAYMKSMSHWLTAEDFIRLTSHLDDRRIFVQQHLAFHDGTETVVFDHDIPGQLLREPRGFVEEPVFRVVSLDVDHGLSLAEIYDAGKEHEPNRLRQSQHAWRAFAAWYQRRAA